MLMTEICNTLVGFKNEKISNTRTLNSDKIYSAESLNRLLCHNIESKSFSLSLHI